MHPNSLDLFDLAITHLQTLYDKEIVKNLRTWLKYYKAENSTLYRIKDLKDANKTASLTDEANNISYASVGGSLFIRIDNKEDLEFPWSVAEKALEVIGSLLEPYLPLGSVVDLKKEAFSKGIAASQVEHLRMVITKRFLAIPDTLTYFPYGGEIYPLGSFGEAKLMYFSSALIESVVHTGYSDETEDAFILLMKKGLVIDKGYHSIGFVREDEKALVNKALSTNYED